MPYVIRRSGNSAMLYEVSAKEAKKLLAGTHDQACYGITFTRCSGIAAHRWVERGLPHATGLYVADNGRVRKATSTEKET
jgi:hypothetical protein